MFLAVHNNQEIRIVCEKITAAVAIFEEACPGLKATMVMINPEEFSQLRLSDLLTSNLAVKIKSNIYTPIGEFWVSSGATNDVVFGDSVNLLKGPSIYWRAEERIWLMMNSLVSAVLV